MKTSSEQVAGRPGEATSGDAASNRIAGSVLSPGVSVTAPVPRTGDSLP